MLASTITMINTGKKTRWIIVSVIALTLGTLPAETGFIMTTTTTFSNLFAVSSWNNSNNNNNDPIRFIPYPHRQIGVGKELQCVWKSRKSSNDAGGDKKKKMSKDGNRMTNQETSSLLFGTSPTAVTTEEESTTTTTDLVQEQALSEGVCLPMHKPIADRFHLFSTEQARQCLSHQTVIVSGDSFAHELYIGLGDVLLGKPSNVEAMDDTERWAVFQSTQEVSLFVSCLSTGHFWKAYTNAASTHLLAYTTVHGNGKDQGTQLSPCPVGMSTTV